MDMSLDELIMSKWSSSPGVLRGGKIQGFSGSDRGRASNFRSDGTVGGAVGGRGSPMRRGRSMARRTNGLTPYSKGVVNASWTHDMYEEPKGQQLRGVHKIVISNLDFGVTSTDIQELFEEFGQLKTATVHYDKSGRSLGTADVVFGSKNAVLKAVRQYHNVPLDGRPMKIDIATDLSTVDNLVTRISRPAPVAVQSSVKKDFYKGVKGNQDKRGNTRGTYRGRRAGGSNGEK